MASRTKNKPKRPSVDGNASETIRAAAASLFAERGYHATTMRELGRKLGITAPSLYNHYSEKQDILFDIANGTMLALLEGGEQAIASSDDPEIQFRTFLESHVVFHAERQLEAKVADGELHSLEPKRRKIVVKTRDSYEQILRDILEDGRTKAGWQLEDISVITFGIFTMGTGTASWFRPNGRLNAADVARIYADFCLKSFSA